MFNLNAIGYLDTSLHILVSLLKFLVVVISFLFQIQKILICSVSLCHALAPLLVTLHTRMMMKKTVYSSLYWSIRFFSLTEILLHLLMHMLGCEVLSFCQRNVKHLIFLSEYVDYDADRS